MPLVNIKADLMSDAGFKASSQQQTANALSLINDAAAELYDNNDFPNCQFEQLFQLGVTDQQITLPYFVDRIDAIRDYDSRYNVNISDMRPRYASMGWTDDGWYPYKWSIKQTEAPLAQNIQNEAPVTLTISSANGTAFNVSIVMVTANSAQITEVVSFGANDTTKTTVNVPTDIKKIVKDIVTQFDITLTDADGNVLAVLQNSEKRTSYTWVQVLDRYQVRGQTQLVEILYKKRFTPFSTDADSFPCGDKYDKAIYWKAIELFSARKDGPDNAQKAIMAQAKCNQIITQLTQNMTKQERQFMDFGQNKWRRITENTGVFGLDRGVRGLVNSWSNRRY